jgi:hypothetical protein
MAVTIAVPLPSVSPQIPKAIAGQIRRLELLRHGQADSEELDEFDAESEQLIRKAFGDATDHLEAYELAMVGEAESIVNMPQAAQEDAVQDVPLKAIEQRRQVLEGCLAELDLKMRRPESRAASPVRRATGKKAAAPKKARRSKPRRAASKKKAGTAGKKNPAKKKKKGRGK